MKSVSTTQDYPFHGVMIQLGVSVAGKPDEIQPVLDSLVETLDEDMPKLCQHLSKELGQRKPMRPYGLKSIAGDVACSYEGRTLALHFELHIQTGYCFGTLLQTMTQYLGGALHSYTDKVEKEANGSPESEMLRLLLQLAEGALTGDKLSETLLDGALNVIVGDDLAATASMRDPFGFGAAGSDLATVMAGRTPSYFDDPFRYPLPSFPFRYREPISGPEGAYLSKPVRSATRPVDPPQ
jgi:hypothetical protein